MAVTRDQAKSTLQIQVEAGQSATGTTIYKTMSFGSLNPEITDANAYSLGAGLSDIVVLPISAVRRQDTVTLIDDGE